jgi:hypothetical protein
MILVCGIPSEPPLALLVRELDAVGAPFAVFNQRRFATCAFELEVADGEAIGVFDVGGAPIALADVTAVYVRLMDDEHIPELHADPPESPRRRACRDLHARLLEWLEVTPALVVTRAGPNGTNGSKTYQAAAAAAHGFAVPETLVTNDPDEVLDFRDRVGRVVYKSISGIRSIVSELRDEDLLRLDSIRWCPVQFQQAVDGVDVRVHVVGERVFATAVGSRAVDYRYGDAELTAVDLDDDLVEELAPIPGEVADLLDRAELTGALEAAWRAVRRLNRYVEEQAPWQLAKAGEDEALGRVLATLVEGLRTVAVLLHPWIPASADRILEALGAPGVEYATAQPTGGTARTVTRIPPLFPKPEAAE